MVENGDGEEGIVMDRKPLCVVCELKTMYPLSTERSRIDRWTEGETMEEIDREKAEREGE